MEPPGVFSNKIVSPFSNEVFQSFVISSKFVKATLKEKITKFHSFKQGRETRKSYNCASCR